MAEIDIKRVNFFDGQFLKELEFREEQKYHLHMRRRLNYILFNQSGVVRVNADDLKVEVASGKGIKINAGMAISRDTGAMEGKEIILKQDVNKNLTTEGIAAGQTAYVTIHYNEELAKDPPSEGDEDQDTRVKENAVITVHTSDPTTGTAANGEKYILLGTIAYDAMTVTDKRPIAGLNPYLGGGGAVVVGPTIIGISVHSGLPGSLAFDATISGTDLDGASDVTFSGADVSAAIQPGATSTTLPIRISIASTAAPGPRTFTVTTHSGTFSSKGIPAASFEVSAPAPVPVINSFSPLTQKPTFTITITGTNIRSTNLVPPFPKPATGTTVKFVSQANPGTFVLGENPMALGDLSGFQQVEVTVPNPAPTFSTTEVVKVILEIGGQSAAASSLFTFRV